MFHHKNEYKLFIQLFFLAALTALASCGKENEAVAEKPMKIPPAQVSGIIASQSEMLNKIYSTGTILPNEEVMLKPEISGRIIKLAFKEGSRISKGQLLVKLNDKDLKAQLSKIEAQISLAKQDESRKKQLFDKKALSLEELQISTTSLETLLAEKDLIKAQIEKTEIVAPFDGMIGLKYVSEGANVTTATNIANFAQNNPIKIEFSVPESYATLIKPGTELTFSLNNKIYGAKVYAVEGKVDAGSRTYKVRASSPNPKGELVPGSFVKIEIVLDKIFNTIVVPSSVIVNELTGNKVYVADGGFARAANIKVGIRTDSTVQVVSGLNVGDTIISTGLMQIKDKSPVIIKNLAK